MSAVARVAEERNHHPDMHLTNFRYLVVELSSVTAGGVTGKDVEMARVVNELASNETV